jgi:putative membrane protein
VSRPPAADTAPAASAAAGPRVILESEAPVARPAAASAAPPAAGPRVILGDEASHSRPAAPRLDFGWEQAVAPAAPPRLPSRWSGLGRAAAGLAVLLLGLGALDAANFVFDQFARGAVRGLLTLAVVLGGFGLLASAGWAELRGLLSIRAVDRARGAFARGDLQTARTEAVRWAESVPEAASLIPALRGAGSTEELRALLESGPLPALEARAAALGRTAAVQAFSITAVSPSPGLDALVFAWRGVRLVRQVAALHGLRPGLAGSVALLRRTVFDAAAVAATDIAVDAAARALLSNRLLEQFAGEAAAGAVAARRMLRLARVAADACRIVPGSGRGGTP